MGRFTRPRGHDADRARRLVRMRCSKHVVASPQGDLVAENLARKSSCNVPTSVTVAAVSVFFFGGGYFRLNARKDCASARELTVNMDYDLGHRAH